MATASSMADGRLDHGPDPGVVGGAAASSSPSTMACTSSAELTFGTTTPAGPAAAAAAMSSACHGGVEAVHPDGDLLAAVLAGAHRGAHPVAGVGLGVGGDGVLEVEDERVGRRGVLAFSSARSLAPGM